ncbi:Ubiquitin system component Cue [Metarhizium rileyi]|uniref:Coupling of ubiquitin conjugation to ER degradation protein 1 n=1 Tax=Metarhizium rileyi (strain RCEF 4871) TaxID=1649241 RepID=A0A167HB01_METRR|nr:Ubiquitin system component Cue [Metarhizium rileyi RCEF 4871]
MSQLRLLAEVPPRRNIGTRVRGSGLLVDNFSRLEKHHGDEELSLTRETIATPSHGYFNWRVTASPPTGFVQLGMANEQISLPYLAGILLLSGLIIRYLFFSGTPTSRPTRSPEDVRRSRETAVERIQQMFPQTERRTILWDLQRNGGSIQNTTERILAGRLETPPVTFQPPPPPGQTTAGASTVSTMRQADKPTQPDLITRYNLKSKITTETAHEQETKSKGWSSNRDERQESLQKRRDEMILAARRKMEAKIAAEKAT